jgi:hypothetical protein
MNLTMQSLRFNAAAFSKYGTQHHADDAHHQRPPEGGPESCHREADSK